MTTEKDTPPAPPTLPALPVPPVPQATEQEILEALRSYYAMGLHTFPVFPPNHPFYDTSPEAIRGKRPAEKEWQKRPLSDDFSRFKGYKNIGVALKANHIVIDVDVSGNKEGAKSLEKLQEDLNIDLMALSSMVVKTPSGGFHIYFSKTPAFKVKKEIFSISTKKKYKHLDILTENHYAILPPSTHANGGKYEFYKKEGVLRPIPTIFVEHFMHIAPSKPPHFSSLISSIAASAASASPTSTLDNPHVIERAKTYLSTCKTSGEGGRNNITFIVAAHIKDWGLSLVTNTELMLSFYNPRLDPPLTQDEVIRTVTSAYARGPQHFPPLFSEKLEELASPSPSESPSPSLLPPPPEEPVDPDAWIERLETTEVAFIKHIDNDNFRNAALFLDNLPQLKGLIGYNTLSRAIYTRKATPWHSKNHSIPPEDCDFDIGLRWTDQDTALLRLYFASMYFNPQSPKGFSMSKTKLDEAVHSIAVGNQYNPVKIKIEKFLKNWDKTPRLDTWLIDVAGAEDNIYTREVSRMIMMALIFRTYDPGHKFDFMPILEGEQNRGKSAIWERLAIHPDWFSDATIDLSNMRNIQEMLSGKLIIEFGEMCFMTRNSTNEAKRFVASKSDQARAAYSRYVEEPKRICIAVATTNEEEYLKDRTGNRRYLPIRTNIPRDEVSARLVHLEQIVPHLYGEALACFLHISNECQAKGIKISSYELVLSPAAEDMAKEIQADRLPVDTRIHALSEYLDGRVTKSYPDGVVVENGKVMAIEAHHIASAIFNVLGSKVDAVLQRNIAALMEELGWERVRKRVTMAGGRTQMNLFVRPNYAGVVVPLKKNFLTTAL